MDLKEAMKSQLIELVELKTRMPGQTEPAYYRPMTLADHDKIQRVMKAENTKAEGFGLVINIIHKVLDKDGKKIFSNGDRQFLLNSVDQRLIVAIVNEMAEAPDIEQAKGN